MFDLPRISDRVAVFGRTGSGKTVFLTWLLSMATIDEIPWIVIDNKRDGYLRALPRVREIAVGELPRAPGLYIAHPGVNDDDAVDTWLHAILRRGRTGVFTDEGASLPQREPKYRGLKALFAQGRSKQTPVLFATQRPSFINRSILSEADFFALFRLQHADDRDRAGRFFPDRLGDARLPAYHAHWYDVKRDDYYRLTPVDPDAILETISDRLAPVRRFL